MIRDGRYRETGVTRRCFTECVFCGVAPPLTKEHVWPKWLRDVLTSSAKFPHRHTTTVAGVPEKKWQAPPFSMQLQAVCASCNNNWMANIEGTAKPILIPMIGRGERRDLTVDDQRILARWVAQRAMVFQLATIHDSIRPHQYRFLKDHLQPPPSTQIWLAKRTNEEPIPSGYGIRTSDLRNSVDERGFHNYLATIAIGHFVAQFYGYDHPYDSEWSRHGPFEASLVQVWPAREPVTWPPPELLRTFVSVAEDPAFEGEVDRVFLAHGQEVRLGRPRSSAMPH